jgi:hypothetical protein
MYVFKYNKMIESVLSVCEFERLCVVTVLTFAVFAYFSLILRRFLKEHTSLPAVNLSDQRMQTQTQKFIAAYYKLKEDGVPEENLYAAALDVVNVAGARKASSGSAASAVPEAQKDTSINIKDIFKD